MTTSGFGERARALLQDDGFEVVGEAADGETAVEAAHRLRPQVVLLDVQLPGIDGFEVAERLAAGARSARGGADLQPGREQPTATGCSDSSARGFIAKAELSGERLSSLLAEPRARRFSAWLCSRWARSWSAARRCLRGRRSGRRARAARRRHGGVGAACARRLRRLMVLAGAAWFAGDVFDRCCTPIAGRSRTCC